MDMGFKIIDAIKSNNTCEQICKLNKNGILEKIIPEVKSMKEVGKCKYHKVDCFTHTIYALEEFEKEVINVSRRGIVMHDMHQENIILTPNNSLVAIDTDMFEVTYDYEIWVLRNNMKELGETIISELVTLAKLESEKLNNLINDCGAYGRIRPSNLLREFISYFEQRMFKTETVSDFKNGVQLIKKR